MGLKDSSKDSSAPHCGENENKLIQRLISALEKESPTVYLEDKYGEDQGREHLRDDGLPLWFDEERFKRGAELFERNIFLMFNSKMAGLLTLLAIPSIVKVLAMTRKSGEAVTAFRRYVDTTNHMLFWYRTSITDPKSQCRESLAVVRGHHLRGSAASRKVGMPGISQLDLVLTQFAFVGFAVVRRKVLHLDASDQDLLDFVHFWRTLGCLVGIQDRFNICQFDCNLQATEVVFEEVCAKWIAPAMLSPPPEFDGMSRALIDGLWCSMPVLEYGSFLNFTEELSGIPPHQRTEPATGYGKRMLIFLHFTLNSLDWHVVGKLFRMYHNASMRFSLYMSKNYPLLAWYSFPGNNTTKYKALLPNET